jgi:GNAT superfamily N-acetyltransferase
MIEIRKATAADVEGICRVCTAGWRDAYTGLLPTAYIEQAIAEFYNPARVAAEVADPQGWDGWWVAVERGRVVGAGGGGLPAPGTGELFVLYVDPARRGAGIGTRLLAAITQEERAQGAREQWVSVAKGNHKGIPFYEARGFRAYHEQPIYGSRPEDAVVSVRYQRALDGAGPAH